ncbi:MAG: hypothetical protein ACYDER_25830 [Ktedonobacteraceae bacterium]
MMSEAPKRWQARIEIGVYSGENFSYRASYVYGETISALRSAAYAYLSKEKPARFCNTGDHIAGRMTYFYYYEGMENEGGTSFPGQHLTPGWWFLKESMIHGHLDQEWRSPEKLESFEHAIDHFVANALIPEKGTDYQSRALAGNNLRLALVERVVREAEEYPINDLIRRGWHIVALEYKGELSMSGELMNRKAVFVMGHPELQAATITLNADYYKHS